MTNKDIIEASRRQLRGVRATRKHWHSPDYPVGRGFYARVNWVKDAEYYNTQSNILNTYFKELWNSKKEIYIHDPETSNDQSDEVLRVLDDAPEQDWFEFLTYNTPMENHRGFSKEQRDGCTLVVIREAYPGATELPPLYLLIKE